jgi:hypothetical protein
MAELLTATYRSASAPLAGGCADLEEVDGVLLVDGWFRRHKDERARVREPQAALLDCRHTDPCPAGAVTL